jgi:hypothetical protein
MKPLDIIDQVSTLSVSAVGNTSSPQLRKMIFVIPVLAS